MARKKKAAATKKKRSVSRKKTKQKEDENIVKEFGGWKLGDLAWGQRLDGGKVYGEIVQFHPEDSIAPAVSIIDQVVGGYRVVKVESLTEAKQKGVRSRANTLKRR